MTVQAPSFDQLASFNKAAGDALRLEVLRVLAQDAYGVLELSQIFAIRQSGMSHHLKVLAEAGLVSKRREGNSIFYSRSLPSVDKHIGGLQQQLFATVDQLVLSDGVQQAVQSIKEERAVLSQEFFAAHGDKFKAQQDLIAEFPTYGQLVADLLKKTVVPQRQLAIEIGPGAGEFLPVLAQDYQQVMALDNAPAMLAQAQVFCEQQALLNVNFVQGDTRDLHQQQADCMVINMVLHHTPSPADIFQDIALGLKVEGVLIVTELCHHDQDWAREACGDLWLGFDPSELKRWAALVGLEHGYSHYFALRNGFQVQLQQFKKISE